MRYTKSELREAKKSIEKECNAIIDNAPYIHTDAGFNVMCNVLVVSALRNLLKTLPSLKAHIIDNDDYNLALEINKIISPAWNVYCSRANVGEFETHSEAHLIQNTITDLRDWIKEQEPSHSKPTTEGFLKAFESIAHDCIASIGFKYKTRVEKPKLPDIIVQEYNVYQSTKLDKETLTQEISSHLSRCKTPSETEQYVCSLLLPFKEMCGILRPLEQTEESMLFIKLLCTGTINLDRLKAGTIEHCLSSILNDMNDFSMCLYGVLEKNCLDLNEYQHKTGVYLRREWNPAKGLFFNLGDWDLIESLAQVGTPSKRPNQVQEKTKPNRYNSSIKESNARKIFSLLASQGYISKNTQPCEWLWICGINTEKEPTTKQIDWLKGQNELAYFVDRMFKNENENDLWVITSSVFTIKGKEQKTSNLKVANSKVSIKYEKKMKLDNILKYK